MDFSLCRDENKIAENEISGFVSGKENVPTSILTTRESDKRSKKMGMTGKTV